MELKTRRQYTIIEDRDEDFGRRADTPIRKAAVIAVIGNPYVGRYVDDLTPMIQASADLGRLMARRVVAAMGDVEVQSYGKGGLVGIGGEQEHANAVLTTEFANPIRDALGGGKAWISSMTKVTAPGTTVDIPMNHKDDVYVRSHYDGMTITLPDTPMPDEIAVIICVASRGRLNARVGGLTHEEVQARG
ncbi:amino acid synthesis family protein [Microbaculum marinum]|uniref:Amino acid synthesis family protein n=1 Tax=Microbaculum marinum TaxID=1764581 RepID=A0AAW9RB40_9HYPH